MTDDAIEPMTRAMADGDAGAIERFYRAYFDAMLAMARAAVPSRRRDEAFALDVVGDATLRVVRCVRPIATERHLLNWTRLVVQSCALDRLRRDARRQRRERATLPSGAADDREEELRWLEAEIGKLEPTLAALLRRRYADGWTLARIAAALGTTTGQIDGRLRRAVAALRASAKAAFDE